MFVTPEEVMEVTPYTDVTVPQVRQAQFVIETFLGKTETEIDDPSDVARIRRAVIYQTVYMRDNPDITFNQIAVSSISRGDGLTVFRAGDFASPFVAPLALMSLHGLSWRRTRSIKIGRLHAEAPRIDWRRD